MKLSKTTKSRLAIGVALVGMALAQIACVSENPIDQQVERTVNNAPVIVESISNGIVESGQSLKEIGNRASSVAK